MSRRVATWVVEVPRRLAIGLVRAYQLFISPLLGPCCRFSPSCSHYGIACLRSHGLLRGGWLTLKRLSRCHPWHPGGYDPPPLARHAAGESVQAPSETAGELPPSEARFQ